MKLSDRSLIKSNRLRARFVVFPGRIVKECARSCVCARARAHRGLLLVRGTSICELPYGMSNRIIDEKGEGLRGQGQNVFLSLSFRCDYQEPEQTNSRSDPAGAM